MEIKDPPGILIGETFTTLSLKAGFCPNHTITSSVPRLIISSISVCLSHLSSFSTLSNIVTFAPGTMAVFLNWHFEIVWMQSCSTKRPLELHVVRHDTTFINTNVFTHGFLPTNLPSDVLGSQSSGILRGLFPIAHDRDIINASKLIQRKPSFSRAYR